MTLDNLNTYGARRKAQWHRLSQPAVGRYNSLVSNIIEVKTDTAAARLPSNVVGIKSRRQTTGPQFNNHRHHAPLPVRRSSRRFSEAADALALIPVLVITEALRPDPSTHNLTHRRRREEKLRQHYTLA